MSSRFPGVLGHHVHVKSTRTTRHAGVMRQAAAESRVPSAGGAFVLLVLDARRRLGCEGPWGSWATRSRPLAMMQALTVTDLFDALLLASPSSWYPGFVNMIERTPLACRPFTRIVLASRADEGAGEPEPICAASARTPTAWWPRSRRVTSARPAHSGSTPGRWRRGSPIWWSCLPAAGQ